nr:glycerol-3-phosphate acyltransferase [Mycoplasmopsis bovis]
MNVMYSILINLALFLVGYLLLGSFNTSIILSRRVKNDDIREHNSKNAGATNSLRTYGTKFALAVFASWCTKNTYSYFNNCLQLLIIFKQLKSFRLFPILVHKQ